MAYFYFGDKIVIKPFMMGAVINKFTTSELFLPYIYMTQCVKLG